MGRGLLRGMAMDGAEPAPLAVHRLVAGDAESGGAIGSRRASARRLDKDGAPRVDGGNQQVPVARPRASSRAGCCRLSRPGVVRRIGSGKPVQHATPTLVFRTPPGLIGDDRRVAALRRRHPADWASSPQAGRRASRQPRQQRIDLSQAGSLRGRCLSTRLACGCGWTRGWREPAFGAIPAHWPPVPTVADLQGYTNANRLCDAGLPSRFDLCGGSSRLDTRQTQLPVQWPRPGRAGSHRAAKCTAT